jgi:hypothetical protein
LREVRYLIQRRGPIKGELSRVVVDPTLYGRFGASLEAAPS